MIISKCEIPETLCVLIPQFDHMTQGINVQHAVGMGTDLARIVIEDSLDSQRYDPLKDEFIRRPVRHPYRLADDVSADGDYEEWRRFRAYWEGRESSFPFVGIRFKEFIDMSVKVGIIPCNATVETFGGIANVIIEVRSSVLYVPVKTYSVLYDYTVTYTYSATLPNCSNADPVELARASVPLGRNFRLDDK